jgi:hypothetical protein
VIACCNAARQLLPPVIIFKNVNKVQEFAYGLPPGSKEYTNRKSSYISTDLFKWFIEHFLKNKVSEKVILHLDDQSSVQLSFTASDCC